MRSPRVLAAALLAAALGVACVHLIDPRETANTDIGLQVWAVVTPIEISLSDTVTSIRVRINAKNPGRDTITVNNGGPPCSITPDPAEGRYLMHSLRVASDANELDAGPRGDFCGATLLKFPPRRTRSVDFRFTMKTWRNGWTVGAQQYRLRSYFAGYEGYSGVITVTP